MGNAAASEVLTAANYNKNAAGWLGWAQVTANQGSIDASADDLTGLTLTITVPASRLVDVRGSVQFFSATAGDRAAMLILEDGTEITGAPIPCPTANYIFVSERSVVRSAPSAGAHTWKLQGVLADGTGAVTMAASATRPAQIVVVDLGSSS